METNFEKPLDAEIAKKQNSTDNNLSTTAKTVVGAINENASAISSNSTAIAKVQNGLAYIVGNTNTTGGTLAVGQFVYVKGHSTITEGLRTVTASISANGNITTSNTSACSEGGLNALNSNLGGFRSVASRKAIESSTTITVTVPEAARPYAIVAYRTDRRKTGIYIVDASGITELIAFGLTISMSSTTISITNSNAYTIFAEVYELA